MMYGQMTAGSWIYIGTQGILQGTFQTFAALAEQHFGGIAEGQAGGDGRRGRHGRRATVVRDAQRRRGAGHRCGPERALSGAWIRAIATWSRRDLDEALALCEAARREGRALSVGLVGNCADVLPEIVRRGVMVDVVTDQTSAHDPLNGYVPQGLTLSEAAELRQRDPEEYVRRSTATMVVHVNAMLALQRAGRGGLRLWQQHSPLCLRCRLRGCVSDSRICAGVHSAAVLHGHGAVPLGGAVGRSARTLTGPTSWRWSCFRRTRF